MADRSGNPSVPPRGFNGCVQFWSGLGPIGNGRDHSENVTISNERLTVSQSFFGALDRMANRPDHAKIEFTAVSAKNFPPGLFTICVNQLPDVDLSRKQLVPSDQLDAIASCPIDTLYGTASALEAMRP